MPSTLTEPTAAASTAQTLEIIKNEFIAATPDLVFEAILEQMSPLNQTPDGTPLVMTLEAWPGGRWFRDLGNNTGHLWAFVQSIKPGALLELQGPLFMSAPVMGHVKYRLTAEAGGTRLEFSHRATGLISIDDLARQDIDRGWTNLIGRVRTSVQERGGKHR